MGRQVMRFQVRVQRAPFDASEVERRADETVQPIGLMVDQRGGSATLLVGPGHLGIGQATGRGADTGQRCSQVVRDRIDEGALDAVSLAGDLEVGRRPPELVATEGQRDLVGGQGEDLGLLR